MTTATRPKRTTASSELNRLEQKREKAYAALQDVKRDRDAHDAETQRLGTEFTQHRHIYPEQYGGSTFRPKEGTEAAKQSAAIKRRMTEPNPHGEAFDKALAAFHAAPMCRVRSSSSVTSDSASPRPSLTLGERSRRSWPGPRPWRRGAGSTGSSPTSSETLQSTLAVFRVSMPVSIRELTS